ncbi:MAG: hypothetical protein Q8941_16345 [Bacteroidota bacterium]|nr:hypothetical protein [Bacteroidota bacterium]
MRLTITLFILFLCRLLFPESAHAQEKSNDTLINQVPDSIIKNKTSGQDLPGEVRTPGSSRDGEKRSYFRAEVDYTSDNVYLGRKDSSAIRYLSPEFGYFARSGFFTEATFNFLASAGNSRLDMMGLSAGYSFSHLKYEGEISATRFYYNSQSTNVRSEVKDEISYNNSFEFGLIKPTLSMTLSVGNNTDLGGSIGLEHNFSIVDDKVDITPAFAANASTQNYYNNYYKKRRFIARKKGSQPIPGTVTTTGEVLNASTFKILDYEASLPISYEAGRFSFAFTPVYAIPVHPAEVIITSKFSNGTTTSKTEFEKINNCFFATLEISYKF